MNTISVHIKDDPIINSSRIFKITNSLVKGEVVSRCIIIGKWVKGLPEHEIASEGKEIIRIKTPLQVLIAEGKFSHPSLFRKIVALYSFYFYHATVLKKLFELKNVKFLSIHDPDFFVVSKIYRIIKEVNLIYLPHELESHKTGLSASRRLIVRAIERIFIVDAQSIVFVCDPIMKWYCKKYNLANSFVVRNVPYKISISEKGVKINKFRHEFDIPEDHVIFIYQGVIDESRGCGKLLEVFGSVNKDKHIVMMGYGALSSQVIEMSKMHSNIHFKQGVPIDEIISFTSCADVGVFFLFEEPSLSYKLSLPNKFSECIMAGIPVMVSSHLKYMTELITESNLGWSLSPSINQLTTLINKLTKSEISSIKVNVDVYSENMGWHIEEMELRKAYLNFSKN